MSENENENADPIGVLEKIRKGYKAKLSFKFGGFDCPCRILASEQEAAAIAKAHESADKVPENLKNLPNNMIKNIRVQKEVLFTGTTIGTINYLTKETLDKLSSDELAQAYDSYKTEIKLANPLFEKMPIDEVQQIINAVKKKAATSKDYYMSDLVGIGRYFLDQLSQQANEHGS